MTVAPHVYGMASAIESIVHFCSDVNVGTGPTSECLAKTLVANMQYVDRESLYVKLFGDTSYINWEAMANMQKRSTLKRKGNTLGDSVVWCHLLSFLHGDVTAFQGQLPSSKVAYRPFYLVYESIVAQFKGVVVEAGKPVVNNSMLSLCVRAFFISNLIGIVPMAALEYLMCKHFDRGATAESTAIMIAVSSEKFAPEQYLSTIAWLMSSGIALVDTVGMDKEIQFLASRSQDVTDAMKVHTIQISKSGRPSLAAIIKSERLKRGGGGMSDTGHNSLSYNTYFTFAGFTHRMRFPNSLSIYIQQRAYWLASQCEFFGWRDYVEDFLHKDLAISLLRYGDIQSPDPSVISEVLLNTRIVGAPFPALQLFRNKCLVSMPGLERMGMTMNDVFRLYVAAYQHKEIWKDVWKLIKPILSTQIIKVFSLTCISLNWPQLKGYIP